MNSESEGQLKRPGDDPDAVPVAADQACSKSIVVPNRVVTLANSFDKKERSWYVTSQIPHDLLIKVDDMTFNVHKYPLVSKCGYISQFELQPSDSEYGFNLKLANFPGGAETFETILKFCYGLPLDLNPVNVAPLRCASEYLDMTEEYEDGNLIAKTDAFITFVVLASWKDTLVVLKSCESLSPWAENLQIVRRCCDLLAWKASKDSTPEDTDRDEMCLYDDIATLRIDHFMRVITTTRARGAKPEIIGRIIKKYTDKWLPAIDDELEGLRGYGFGKNDLQFGILKGTAEEGGLGYKEQRAIIESLVSILPPQPGAVSCQFLLRMLKTAMVYSASAALISDLEKRVGIVLEDASVSDLLIPNYKNEDQGKAVSSPEQYAFHNVDVVQRILEYYLMHEQQQQQEQQKTWKPNITKLVDNYLAEIAKDPNLSISKFHVLAEALPESARKCHDGLYRAIDTYLKTHHSLSEHDRRRLCKTMNCEKLSLDACMHAAQNERLPLRTIIQVLFSEQVKLRMAMQQKEPEMRDENTERGENQGSTETEIKTLRAELENVKDKMTELQNDYSELQQEYEKLGSKQKTIVGRGLLWKKIKKSFQMKQEGNETGDGQQRRSSMGLKASIKRRLSLSLS